MIGSDDPSALRATFAPRCRPNAVNRSSSAHALSSPAASTRRCEPDQVVLVECDDCLFDPRSAGDRQVQVVRAHIFERAVVELVRGTLARAATLFRSSSLRKSAARDDRGRSNPRHVRARPTGTVCRVRASSAGPVARDLVD
jgi:hypothetical protein